MRSNNFLSFNISTKIIIVLLTTTLYFIIMIISDTVRFWSFLVTLIPSTICSLFVLYHLLFYQAFRRALNNHAISILVVTGLIAEVTIYPWMLYYYQYKDVWERSHIFCVIWGFLDWSLYVVHTVLFGWTTIERHILIFHNSWVSTRTKRFFIHYVPLISIVFGLFLFYIVIYFFPYCGNFFYPSSLICVYPCMYDNYAISMSDFIVNQIVPIFTIVVFSIGLLVRVARQKYRIQRRIHWRKHRTIIIQTLSISFLYIIVLVPYVVIYILGRIYNLSSSLISDLSTVTVFFSYFILLLFPFVCAFSLSQPRTRIEHNVHLRRQLGQVGPTIFTVRARAQNRIHNL